jgi:PAS domain S-box-containing protein
LEAGADGYLVMPGEPAELVAQVRALLRLQAAERIARQAQDALAAEIRERERVEEALRRSENRFRTMADGLPVMIWADDANGNCVFVNAAYEAFFGVTEAEVTTGGWQPFVHPDDSAHYVEEFLACTRERRPFLAEARVRRCDGEWRWIESRGAPRFSETGEFLGFVGSSPDVTDRKQADAEREAMLADNNRLIREAQDANRSKDRFLATVSHELRQPLNAMVMALHVMAARAGRESGQRARDTIERQVHQLSSLVDDLLDASRLQNDKVTLRTQLIDVREVARQAVEVVGPEVQQRRQVLAIDLPPSALIVDADRVRLQQVLTNLLLNAAKFTPDGGTITVVARAIPHLIEVTVSDTGVGLTADEIPRIFDLFAQSSRREGDGLGIGLAVARKLVALHGGSISAQSGGPRHGSTFRVLLPVLQENAVT